MSRYTMTIKTVGNPDFGQDHRKSVSPESHLTFATLAEAGPLLRAYVDQWSIGSGNLCPVMVTDEDGNDIARVSYNGRVWPPGPWTPSMQPLEV